MNIIGWYLVILFKFLCSILGHLFYRRGMESGICRSNELGS